MPLVVTPEIATAVPPLLVTVSERVALLPTVTLPKLRFDALTATDPNEAPVPERGTVIVGFDAFDKIVALPLAVPEEVGVKLTTKLVLWPAFRVNGRLIPFTLYPLPLAVTPEIVTAVPPVLVMESASVWLLPMVTVPKLTLEALTDNVPTEAPLPERGTLNVGFELFDERVTLPLTDPTAAGLKITLKLALWPAFRVNGAVIPLTLNPVPVALTPETVTLVALELLKVRVCVCCVPTVTLPKDALVGLAASVPEFEVALPDTANFTRLFAALLITATFALKDPDIAGVN